MVVVTRPLLTRRLRFDRVAFEIHMTESRRLLQDLQEYRKELEKRGWHKSSEKEK